MFNGHSMATLSDLLQLNPETEYPDPLSVHVQIEEIRSAQTSTNKPYFDLSVADSAHKAKFKIWSDSQAFEFCQQATSGHFCELTGIFFINNYGLNVNRPEIRSLNEDETANLLAGSPERRAEQEKQWDNIQTTFSHLEDERLKLITTACLETYEKKWRRAAAARTYHHARRGGLLDHTSQMLKCAQALAPLYPEVQPDLLYCGVLFHDVGKLWENDYSGDGFISKPNRSGEMLGHISIGIEIVNKLWREISETQPDLFSNTNPPSDLLRDHLLHLIASHHGSREFGSPVTPRTPEAWLLHHIDNIDAKMEMMRCTYAEKPEVIPGMYEPRRPLEGMMIEPISNYK